MVKEGDMLIGLDTDAMYREFAKPVYCYLLSLSRSEQTAEELTQETFYQAVKSISRYDGSCQLKSWLFQIAKHLWYHELSKRKHEAPCDEALENAVSECDVEKKLEMSEQRICLYRRIQELEEPYKSVIYLRLAGDLSFEEIGQVLARPTNWARVTYYRAKERLKNFEKD